MNLITKIRRFHEKMVNESEFPALLLSFGLSLNSIHTDTRIEIVGYDECWTIKMLLTLEWKVNAVSAYGVRQTHAL